jgi:hypothetical protein
MKKKSFLILGMLVMVLTLGLILTGCPNGGGEAFDDAKTIKITGIINTPDIKSTAWVDVIARDPGNNEIGPVAGGDAEINDQTLSVDLYDLSGGNNRWTGSGEWCIRFRFNDSVDNHEYYYAWNDWQKYDITDAVTEFDFADFELVWEQPHTAEELVAEGGAFYGKATAIDNTITFNSGTVTLDNNRWYYAMSGINFVVPEDSTLDITADGAALGLGDITLTVNGMILTSGDNLRYEDSASEVIINGSGSIYQKGKGAIIRVEGNKNKAKHILTLDGVTLVGVDDNNESLVTVSGNLEMGYTGELIMKSGKITNNIFEGDDWAWGGGVRIENGATFTMEGGEISGNKAMGGSNRGEGGGIAALHSGQFIMKDGAIFNNTEAIQ